MFSLGRSLAFRTNLVEFYPSRGFDADEEVLGCPCLERLTASQTPKEIGRPVTWATRLTKLVKIREGGLAAMPLTHPFPDARLG
jgi:hypothetical protein